jgi:hypothetical protein
MVKARPVVADKREHEKAIADFTAALRGALKKPD